MGIKAFRVAPVLLLFLILSVPTCFAQYDPNDLFQFSRYWQQEPTNETGYDLNLDPGPIIDESDLLLLIQGWRSGPPAPTPTPTPPKEITIDLPGGVTLEMVKIPAGSFMMGRYAGEQDSYWDEDPQHQVTISQDFYLGKYEVTKAQWTAAMGTTPWSGGSHVLNDLNSPAVYISWNDCQNFVTELNKLGQGTFRLPSEAEWEYACRAGTQTRFYWGDDPSHTQISDYAWYYDNAYNVGEQYAHIVGQKLPNAWGLHDMSGNVWEWCQDYWHDNYTGAPANGSAWESPTSIYRVLQGGGWDGGTWYCRSASRNRNGPDYRLSFNGVRVVRTQ